MDAQSKTPETAYLVERFVQGDRDVLGELFQQEFPILVKAMESRLYRLSGSPQGAADFVQEAFLKLLDNPEQFAGGNFRSFMLTVASNKAIDHGRKSKVRKETSLQDDYLPGRSEADARVRDEEMLELEKCIDKLEDPRLTILRQRFRGTRARAIGEELGLTEADINRHTHHAKKQVKQCMKQKGLLDSGDL